MNFIFLVLVLMPRFLKANFLEEGMIRVANFVASFTWLCSSNQEQGSSWRTLKSKNLDNYKLTG